MANPQDKSKLAHLSRRIALRLGLHYPEDRWPDLVRALEAVGREAGLDDPLAVADDLAGREVTPRELEVLACHLTVGETYFFREPASFELLEQVILPRIVARRATMGRAIRLWSAGCCSGEEAYSLAITCARALPDLPTWNVSILATDLNPRFLAKAEAGVYSEWSFRGTPEWVRQRYFSPVQGKKVAIAPEVKRLVRFAYLNLAEDPYPALHNHTNAMDVIFCRNVLMYFTPEHQRRVVAALHGCLVDGGCLFVNPAEAGGPLLAMFDVEHVGGVVVCHKSARPVPCERWPEPGPSPQAAVERSPEPAVEVDVEAPAAAVDLEAPAAAGQAPDDPLATARACADQGRLDDALAAVRAAIELTPTNPTAHFLQAMVCQELGRLGEAVTALGKVLYLDQDFLLAHHALGDLYGRLGRPRDARRHLAIALQLLSARGRDEIVPESGGMTCGRLVESVHAMMGG